jgi:hypothetical protein
MIPGLMAFGDNALARLSLSGCELGGSPAATACTTAHVTAVATDCGRLAIDNNLIAIGVSLRSCRDGSRLFAVLSTGAGLRS